MPARPHAAPRRSSVTAVIGAATLVAAAAGSILVSPAGATGAGALLSAPQAGRTVNALGAIETAQQTMVSESSTSLRSAADAAAAAQAAAQAEAARVAVEAERAAAAERAAREAADRAGRAPTQGYRITATFGSGGGLWSSGRHTGLDFAAPSGTPVFAVLAGTVVSAGRDGAYGNKIVLRHSDGTETWYCHLSRITVRNGDVVAGQNIGAVGATGNVTGPHLHLEVRPGGGDPVNPATWLRARGIAI